MTAAATVAFVLGVLGALVSVVADWPATAALCSAVMVVGMIGIGTERIVDEIRRSRS